MAVKPQKPALEDVHMKVRASMSIREDKERAANAVDAIKAYGIDDFFCIYAKYLNQDYTWEEIARHYICAAELYHGSKQHWRRRT
jgi:hypothetical protein